jgi:hypothetical protein
MGYNGKKSLHFGGLMRESVYQAQIIKELKFRFPGCLVLKNDSSYIQGIPDLIILYNDRWAALEVKTSSIAPVRPNQEYYINMMNNMSFAEFIDPENEQDVLDALQHTLSPNRSTRYSEREQVSLDQLR